MKNSIHDKIVEYCKKKDIYFWSCKSSLEKRAESYFIFGKSESNRYGEIESHLVNLWTITEKDGNKFIGNSSVSISENSDDKEIADKIDNTIIAANLIKNPFYEIPKDKFIYNNFSNVDPLIKESPLKAIEKLSSKIIDKSKKFDDIRLSTTELFVSHIEENFTNSSGNKYSFEKTKIMLEGVFLAGNNLETESFFTKNSVFIDDLDLDNFLDTQAKYARDVKIAQTLKTGKYNVVFSNEALDSFFDFYYTHANAMAVYNKFSLLKPNEAISKNLSKQNFTLKVDPFIKGGIYSNIADEYGIPLKQFTVIENGILKNFISTLPYSKYLNIPYTGPSTNFILEKGDEDLEKLTSNDNTILLLRFSAFSPKAITGDFSSEIRLGYITKNGKKIPIKGGSVSGNIRNLISSLKLSNKIVKIDNYIGPDGIYLEGVDIAGD